MTTGFLLTVLRVYAHYKPNLHIQYTSTYLLPENDMHDVWTDCFGKCRLTLFALNLKKWKNIGLPVPLLQMWKLY